MKCGKVKNPCKICFRSVSNRNGLQCKGACKKWAHFKCLNYTPGKISDIKAGIIKVTCPCPDCITSQPREILTDPPFTCTNEKCPATQSPTCEVPECPRKQNPIPDFPFPVSGSPKQLPEKCLPPSTPPCPTPPIHLSFPPSPLTGSPARRASPPRQSSCPSSPKKASPTKTSPCPISPQVGSPARRCSPVRKISCSSSPQNASPRGTSPPRKISCPSSPRKASPQGSAAARPPRQCPVHCPLRQKIGSNKDLSPRRSQSCALDSPGSFHSENGMPRTCSSDSALLNAQDQKMLYGAIEEMCETVGQLSYQLKDLMCKMMIAFEKTK